MTPAQKRFVDEYLVNGFNATEAAKSAGYSDKSAYSQGHRLLKKAEIKKAIEKAQNKLSEKLEITKESLIQELIEIRERCLQQVPVLDREGNETGEWTFEAHAAIKSIAETNKMLGFYAPAQTELSGRDGKPLQIQPVDPRLIVQEASKLLAAEGDDDFE